MGVEEGGGTPEESSIETIETSTKRAEELYGKYKDQILDTWYGEGEPPEGEINPDKLINRYLKNIPSEIRARYWGHGIVRGDDIRQLAAVINIAANHAISGWAGRLTDTGYGAWTDGSFLVLSSRDQHLLVRDGERTVMMDKDRAKANIGAIVVNSYFDPLTEELQAMFPDLHIIRARQLPEYLEGDKQAAEE